MARTIGCGLIDGCAFRGRISSTQWLIFIICPKEAGFRGVGGLFFGFAGVERAIYQHNKDRLKTFYLTFIDVFSIMGHVQPYIPDHTGHEQGPDGDRSQPPGH